MEVIERFLLYGVDGQRTGLAIDFADEHPIMVPATTAASRPAIGNTAMMRTEQTLHHPIAQLLIIPTLVRSH